MKFKQVKSSVINSIGYDTETKKMIVIFNSGIEKMHTNISHEKYQSLLDSESVGKSYNKMNYKHKIIKRKMNFR